MAIISIAGMIFTLVAGAGAVMAVLAIRISSKKTPRYELSNYD